jgi:hypothetical protein
MESKRSKNSILTRKRQERKKERLQSHHDIAFEGRTRETDIKRQEE